MKYEVYVAESTLRIDESGKRIRENDFGFMTYLAYSLYDWLSAFGIGPKCLTWFKNIHEVRE